MLEFELDIILAFTVLSVIRCRKRSSDLPATISLCTIFGFGS